MRSTVTESVLCVFTATENSTFCKTFVFMKLDQTYALYVRKLMHIQSNVMSILTLKG